ncbi:MAG: lipopolysaccharide transport system ATP-binding protein [Flavobacteriaceae bacterium]|jgi:lipopolysaccharide transport system ATP-binding protein
MEKNQSILSVDSLTKEYTKDGKTLLALNQVSFELAKGEIFGVIGRNGSGKSTLLKVLSKITGPSGGEISYEGVLTSIIEIGTGFHPDLSGRENVFLSANILGFKNAEVHPIYDKVVAFSGLEDFMEMPVKHYSSGMYLRLAFAIAFHSKIDILLLDEVLAVGDADFRRKCYDKIRELKDGGASIILVSHQMEPVIEFCDRCMWLDNGIIEAIGSPMDVIENYLESSSNQSGKIRGERDELAQAVLDLSSLENQFVKVTDLEIKAKGKSVGDEIFMDDIVEIELDCEKLIANESMEFVFTISNLNNVRVLTDSYALREEYLPQLSEKGTYKVRCEIPADLLNRGVYNLGIMICRNAVEFIAEAHNLYRFKISSNQKMAFDMRISTVIKPKLNWEVKKLGD